MKGNVRIRKVNILMLGSALEYLYRQGVDFVDIFGSTEDGQDVISLAYNDEYINPDYTSNFGEEETIKVSDDNIDDLI